MRFAPSRANDTQPAAIFEVTQSSIGFERFGIRIETNLQHLLAVNT